MKKTFRFLALSLMMLGGTMISWASVKPANGTFVGQTVSGGVVKYQVVDGPAIDYKAKNLAGDEVDVKAYPVEISGLDYDGLTAKSLTELNIATSFTEKYGDELNGYYVTRIIDTQGTTDPVDGDGVLYKKAFYAMTDLTSLTFAADANGLAADKFTFSVGNYAFYGCTSLETLVLPDNVNKIGKYAFQGTVITNFTIPAKCEKIGACAFNDTKKLGTVTVSTAGNEKLKTIDQQVFANSFVSKLDLTNATALESINDLAFIFNVSDVNAQLKEVILPLVKNAKGEIVPSKFVSLGAKGTCFANCMALQTIGNLQYSIVPEILSGAFQNCVELTELNLPATASIVTDLTDPTKVISPFLNTPKLKKITFADGWGYIGGTDTHKESIASGVYFSTIGKKIKYNSSTKKYELEDYTLSETDLANELSHLETIEFKGKVYGIIDRSAFGTNAGGTPAWAACSGLKAVKFAGLICQGASILASAFQDCEDLATLTFNGFEIENKAAGDILIDNYAFAGTAIAKAEFGGFTFYGQEAGGTISAITINSFAFVCENLASVDFGAITFKKCGDKKDKDGLAHSLNLNNNAFVSDKLTTVNFGDIINDNGSGLGQVNIGTGSRVFAPKSTAKMDGVLETVTFGKLVTGAYNIGNLAFQSVALKKVEFKDVTTVKDKNGSLSIGYMAFGYSTEYTPELSKANEKEVIFGNIVETYTAPNKNNLLTVLIGEQAFQGDKLKKAKFGEIGADKFTVSYSAFYGNFAPKTVEMGNITSKDFYFSNYAFAGYELTSVTIGDIIPKNTADQAYFAGYSFGNLSTNTSVAPEEPINMTVTIGQLANTKLDILANAFKGPQKDGSTYDVTIKAKEAVGGKFAGLVKDPKSIAANAFQGPAVGTTTYTLGDIDATAGIAAGAFAGSLDENGIWNTDVEIGNYNVMFPANETFTKVDDLTAASWNVSSYVAKIGTPVTLTVTGNVTKNLWGDGAEGKITSLTIGGNVVAPASIADFGKAVRHIEFSAEDPQVRAGAIVASAFERASDDALAKGEALAVIYRVKTAKNSNAIFDKFAFSTTDAVNKNVVLYTDQWSLEHTFQNVEIGGDDERVYRIMLSASDVAPGEDIAATCVKGANGKYAYGRLYIPAGKGMRYKVSAEYDVATNKNGVNLFSATISGANIYMHQLTVMEGYYWIDATESAQTLIVRTSDVSAAQVTVEAEAVTEAEAQEMDAAGTVILDNDWFDATSAKKNALKYATSAITPAEFQNDATTYNKNIYVMANPAKNNLAFALYDQTNSETKDLNKGSIYVVSRTNKAARLNVIWPEGIDEESEATAINAIETEESSDAIYNLQGVRVNNAQKGIFIINGKKVVK